MMIYESHDPTICRCYHCRAERAVNALGRREWVDDDRPAQKPARYCNWYLVSAVVLVWAVVLLILLVVFGR